MNEQLKNLIKMSISDGKVSGEKMKVLIRKAKEQNIDEDELKIYIDHFLKNPKHVSTQKSGTEYEGIYCSSDDKIILGLCGGLAHKFGVQTSIVRVITFISGFFFIGWLYFVGLFLEKHPTKNVSDI